MTGFGLPEVKGIFANQDRFQQQNFIDNLMENGQTSLTSSTEEDKFSLNHNSFQTHEQFSNKTVLKSQNHKTRAIDGNRRC